MNRQKLRSFLSSYWQKIKEGVFLSSAYTYEHTQTEEMSNKINNIRQHVDILLNTINKIDDYFEYQNDSAEDRKKVKEILNNMNKEFDQLRNQIKNQ